MQEKTKGKEPFSQYTPTKFQSWQCGRECCKPLGIATATTAFRRCFGSWFGVAWSVAKGISSPISWRNSSQSKSKQSSKLWYNNYKSRKCSQTPQRAKYIASNTLGRRPPCYTSSHHDSKHYASTTRAGGPLTWNRGRAHACLSSSPNNPTAGGVGAQPPQLEQAWNPAAAVPF